MQHHQKIALARCVLDRPVFVNKEIDISRDVVVSLRSERLVRETSRSMSPFSVFSIGLLTNFRRFAFSDFSFRDAICSGMAYLQYASCLEKLNHAGAGRALLP